MLLGMNQQMCSVQVECFIQMLNERMSLKLFIFKCFWARQVIREVGHICFIWMLRVSSLGLP